MNFKNKMADELVTGLVFGLRKNYNTYKILDTIDNQLILLNNLHNELHSPLFLELNNIIVNLKINELKK